MEFRQRRADGEFRWVLSTAVPRFAGAEYAGHIGTVVDITQLKRDQEQGVAAQKLESLGVLAGGVAHDFNNLLGSILADSELLLSDLSDGSPVYAGIKRIEAVAVRAAEIVRELLTFAGQENFSFEPVDVSSLVREMLELLKVSISKLAVMRIDLADRSSRGPRQRFPDPPGRDESDHQRLRGARPEGGAIEVSTRLVHIGSRLAGTGRSAGRAIRSTGGQRHRLRHDHGDPGQDLRSRSSPPNSPGAAWAWPRFRELFGPITAPSALRVRPAPAPALKSCCHARRKRLDPSSAFCLPIPPAGRCRPHRNRAGGG